ncbi:ABC transporter permease [Citrobacter koseri]|uniref:ABC transporter permease n=1 Tax=Citrobacter koseri TaxID=545 RepID=A0A2X2YF55_CITKO|nr:ABC transporter permease [Citrobacter koseri]
MIPGLVNTIIALFKDTSLVIIIGLFDLFSSVQQATVDPAWLGMSTEGVCFCRTDLLDFLLQHVALQPASGETF